MDRELIEREAERLGRLIDEGFEQGLAMIELCAALQTLRWALKPHNHAPPSTMGIRPRVKLRLVK